LGFYEALEKTIKQISCFQAGSVLEDKSCWYL